MMYRAHKVRLDPTNTQNTQLARAAGCARFAYNWALSEWTKQYEAHRADPTLPKPSQCSLRKQLNSIKAEQFPWMLESTKCAPQEAIIDLGAAFKGMFTGRGRYPTFKRRGVHDSFTCSAGTFKISGKRIRIPNIGWIRMREGLRWSNARTISLTVSRRAGHWYASISCEIPDPEPAEKTNTTIGVDVGVREYVASDGQRYQAPRSYRCSQKSLRRAQQGLSRKKRGSKNRGKAKARVARLHARIANVRTDWLHKTTAEIARKADVVVIEDLNINGMMKNRRLSTSIADASFGEFRRQIEYKAVDCGKQVVVADRWFPSSKLCSACGAKTKRNMHLTVRVWTCKICATVLDRDLNAAINLAALALPGVPRWQPVESSVPLPASSVSTLCEAGTEHRQALSLHG